MQTERFQTNPRYLATLRLGITVVALLILAGSVLMLWLIDDQDAGLIVALAAVIVGWVVTLILAEPYRGRHGKRFATPGCGAGKGENGPGTGKTPSIPLGKGAPKA